MTHSTLQQHTFTLPEGSCVGLIAGGGLLPALLIEKLKAQGTPYHVVTFKGQPTPVCELDEQHRSIVPLGQVGKVRQILKKKGVTHMLMAGFLSKPSLFDIRPDFTGLKILASLKHKHDDALLTAILDYFSTHGFKVIGAHDILPEIVAKSGVYGKVSPTKEQFDDIAFGVKVAQTLGSLDIGQSVIIKDGVVLGVEGAEGTDGLIKRCAELRGRKNQGGILVKCAKPHQNMNVDMPSVGVETIEKLRNYAYDGVAVLAEKSLILDLSHMVKNADKAGVFVVSVGEDGKAV